MNQQEIREIIIQELPSILQRDPEMRAFVIELYGKYFADKKETESRFDRLMEEMRRDREEQSKQWAEQHKLWAEQNQKWMTVQQTLEENLKAIQALSRKHDGTIGALGARWGLHSEGAFRNALKGTLQELFQVEVLNLTEYDEQGEVFGRPDQIELDLVIKNGLIIVCEIKSSISKAEMYTFERKAQFYAKRHNQKVDRKLVISPMVDQKALEVAKALKIRVYSSAEDLDAQEFV